MRCDTMPASAPTAMSSVLADRTTRTPPGSPICACLPFAETTQVLFVGLARADLLADRVRAGGHLCLFTASMSRKRICHPQQIVRDSVQKPGNYVLSYVCGKNIWHVNIERSLGQLRIEGTEQYFFRCGPEHVSNRMLTVLAA